MLSFQFYVYKVLMKTVNILRGSSNAKYDLYKERQFYDKISKLVKPLTKFNLEQCNSTTFSAEWIEPLQYNTHRVVLYLHGGAYNIGSARMIRSLAVNTGYAANAKVLNLDYRLAPEYPFPAALDDAKNAYLYLLENGYSQQNIIIAGDSAGGGLALALTTLIRDEKLGLPRMVICYSPWTDLSLSGKTYTENAKNDFSTESIEVLRESAKAYCGNASPKDKYISPLFNDLSALPPILIQIGTDEMLLSDAVEFAEKAISAGTIVKLETYYKMQHSWQMLAAFLPEGKKAIANVKVFVEAI